MFQNEIPVLVSWSGGKDSALALYEMMKIHKGPFELFTTINIRNGRIAMHGIPENLLDKQADSLGLPLHKVFIPDPCSNEEYGEIMSDFLTKMKARSIDSIVFGDLFLEDIRKYREENLSKLNFKPLFPLWDIPTTNIALQFIKKGFKAVLTCVDLTVLSQDFSGRIYDLNLLGDLPLKVDPAGENGEFHSFVYDGPIFAYPIEWKAGEKVTRYDRFCYTDLIS